MKNVTVKNFTHAEVADPTASFGFLKIPAKNDLIRAEGENLEVSDGYHTFDELYDHRIRLYMALCKQITKSIKEERGTTHVWCSPRRSDGSEMEGWFVMGIGSEPRSQITYHLPNKYWDEALEFALYLEKAPEWDGHTSNDVLERIKKL